MSESTLHGQWLGNISGTNEGYTVLNVDRDRPDQASLQIDDQKQPHSVRVMNIRIDGSKVEGELSRFSPQDRPMPADLRLGQTGHLSGILEHDILTGTWETDIRTQGAFELTRCEPSMSRPPDQIMSWGKFREWILHEYNLSLIFRGHSDSQNPLVTSFHRTGRRNIFRYDEEDVPRLHRLIEATLDTFFNILDPLDYGCLLNLAQHHGFPTPLLDWTESPFVAAFFAFWKMPKIAVENDSYVRIFVFNFKEWPIGTVKTIADIAPKFARLELRARNNPRVIPQQSINMFSNLADVERYVEFIEKIYHKKFLRRIDIPTSDRAIAMRELNLMGLTAAALFPGLEGLCRSLSEKWF